MISRRLGSGLIASILAALVAIGLVVWFVPSGPSVGEPAFNTGFDGAYVGYNYSQWGIVPVSHPFHLDASRVSVEGVGCNGTLRLVGPPVEGGYLSGVSHGPPGVALTSRRITPALGQQVALVLTSTHPGTCSATQLQFATHSWLRERWTTVPVSFSIHVTHATGHDTRVIAGNPPAL